MGAERRDGGGYITNTQLTPLLRSHFQMGAFLSLFAAHGHHTGSIHHFPCITSSARTQKASLSESLKHEYRGQHKLKCGWLGGLNATKCTWEWQVKRSSGYAGWERKWKSEWKPTGFDNYIIRIWLNENWHIYKCCITKTFNFKTQLIKI